MNWQAFADPMFSGRVCMTLVHSIWQAALLAAVAWSLERLWRRRSVETRYAFHVTALIACLVAMPVTYVLLARNAPGTTTAGEATVDAEWGGMPIAAPAREALPVAGGGQARGDPGSAGSGPGAPGATKLAVKRPLEWLQIAPWLLSFYAIGVLVMFGRLVHGIWQAWRLGSNACRIVDGVMIERLNQLACKWSMRIVPAVAQVERMVVPKVIGLVRPAILLPASAISGLSTDELEMILAHELAHVRRHDMWVNLAQRIAEVVLFFNPAVWYLSRRLSALREYCCDELVCRAELESDARLRVRYASALLRIVELSRPGIAPAQAVQHGDLAALAAAGRSPSDLRRRVARLFGEPLREPVRLSRGGLWTLAVLAAVFLAAPMTWRSRAESASAPKPGGIEAHAGEQDAGSRSARTPRGGERTPVTAPGEHPDGPSGKRVDLPVIVARHVLLLDGKEILTWAELEKRIAGLPDPTSAHPHFYITRGAHEAGLYPVAKDKIWHLHGKFRLKGHSEGSLWPQADLRYDRIETANDLIPNKDLRIEGRVVDSKGEPVGGAEVILVTPVDESISYKACHIVLVQGRVRNPLEHVLTHSDQQGRFSLYPPKDSEFYVVALDPATGFALVAKKEFSESGEVRVLPWGALVTKFDEEGKTKQDASLSAQVPERNGLPEVVFAQYWSDLEEGARRERFGFTHVPPLLETTISRDFPNEQGGSIGLPGAAVSLLPGESRRLDLGPLSDKQREQLQWLRKESQARREPLPVASTSASSPSASKGKPFELLVVGPDGKPVPEAAVEIRTTPRLREDSLRIGQLVKQGPYGTFLRTDEQGRLVLTLAASPSHFNVSIDQPGFGPYEARWDSAAQREVLPSRFTAELEAGWTVGGVIVDTEGRPVEGVKVHPSIEYKKRPGDGGQLAIGTKLTTDAGGRWSFASVPVSMKEVFVEINHPDYRPLRRPLTRSQFGVEAGQEPQVRITLERGLDVTGSVRDESGKPIAGALVRTKFVNDLRRATTGPDGTYRLVGCEPRMARIVVSAAGKAMDFQEVRVEPNMKPVDFTMKPGGKIRIRVLDDQGHPVAKTRVFLQKWRGGIEYFEFNHVNQYTDELGVWQWDEAPLDEIKADICPPGGTQLVEQPLKPREEEYIFRLSPPLVIYGNVVDAATGRPIPKFRVVPGLRSGEPNANPLNWARSESFEAVDGHYELRPNRGYLAHLVRIEADGYEIAVSRDIRSDEGKVQIDFQLKPAADIAATIATPAGGPAAGAKLALGIAGSQIILTNGALDDNGTYAARCEADAAGRFSFPSQVADFQLVITHAAGFAHLKSSDGPVPRTIRLTPWARVEGTLRVGPQVAPNVGVMLNTSAVHSYGPDVPNIFTHYEVTTGPDGGFVFDRVFPGEGRIGRGILLMVDQGATDVTSSTMVPVRFAAGESTRIDLGGTGQPVIGRLAPPPDFKGRVLWNFALVNVEVDSPVPKSPPIPADVQQDPKRREAWWNEWKATEEGIAWRTAQEAYNKLRAASPSFTATADGDGSFRIDDMPAGKYVLTVRFSEHQAGYLSDYRFSVPETTQNEPAQPVDLGLLTLRSP